MPMEPSRTQRAMRAAKRGLRAATSYSVQAARARKESSSLATCREGKKQGRKGREAGQSLSCAALERGDALVKQGQPLPACTCGERRTAGPLPPFPSSPSLTCSRSLHSSCMRCPSCMVSSPLTSFCRAWGKADSASAAALRRRGAQPQAAATLKRLKQLWVLTTSSSAAVTSSSACAACRGGGAAGGGQRQGGSQNNHAWPEGWGCTERGRSRCWCV
jgi:hypothetical protein